VGIRTAGALVLTAATAATACGGGSSATATRAGLRGTVIRGPTAPVCRTGQSCSKPAAKALLLLTRSGRPTVRVRTDAHGRYRALVEPGTYRVTIPRREGMSIAPRSALVTAGRTRRIDFRIDTGIR
jgi:Carboxypeptidase regulatory-like domain